MGLLVVTENRCARPMTDMSDRGNEMDAILIAIVAVFAFAAAGLIFYLLKLNRRAKREQSEVDPSKLRKWSDD